MEMETTIFTCNSSLIILFSPRTLTVFGGKKPKKKNMQQYLTDRLIFAIESVQYLYVMRTWIDVRKL